MKKLITLCVIAISNIAGAQIILEGKVINIETQEPIAYVNIGIKNTKFGTLTNIDGTFSLLITKDHSQDSLQFSAIGFTAVKMSIQKIISGKYVTVPLEEGTTFLDPVVISEKRMKNKTFELGNDSMNGGVPETDTIYAGGSTSLLIKNEVITSYRILSCPSILRKQNCES